MAGQGGAAGGGGSLGGSGGVKSPSHPACGTAYARAGVLEAGDAGEAEIRESVRATVVVEGIDAMPNVVLRSIRLRGPQGERWRLELYMPGFPADRVKVGDVVDLDAAVFSDTIDFFQIVGRTIVLARRGQLILFSTNRSVGGWPDLGAYGIQLADDASGDCAVDGRNEYRGHATTVRFEGASAVVASGSTKRIGRLSFTVNEASTLVERMGQGDHREHARTRMGGFTVTDVPTDAGVDAP